MSCHCAQLFTKIFINFHHYSLWLCDHCTPWECCDTRLRLKGCQINGSSPSLEQRATTHCDLSIVGVQVEWKGPVYPYSEAWNYFIVKKNVCPFRFTSPKCRTQKSLWTCCRPKHFMLKQCHPQEIFLLKHAVRKTCHPIPTIQAPIFAVWESPK